MKVKLFQGFLAEKNQNTLQKITKVAIDSQCFTLYEVDDDGNLYGGNYSQ